MRPVLRVALLLLTLFACVGCDQLSKSAAREQLAGKPTVSLLSDTIRLQYAENSGAFLNLGATLPESARRTVFVLGVGAVVFSLLATALFARKLSMPQRLAFTCISAGGLGNLIDRIAYDGHVTDFLNVGVGAVRTGIFNVADVVLMIGVAVLLFARVRVEQTAGKRRPP